MHLKRTPLATSKYSKPITAYLYWRGNSKVVRHNPFNNLCASRRSGRPMLPTPPALMPADVTHGEGLKVFSKGGMASSVRSNMGVRSNEAM